MKKDDLPVQGTQHWVLHEGLRLFVWEKFAGSPQGKPVLVLAHGSATAGRESFDLKVPGHPEFSLMDYLARQGFDVFALDVRGFGSSTRPESFLTTEQAASDLKAVVDHLVQLRGVPQVHLLAWSWGTQYSGQFVMAHPQKVARYATYAQMHANSPDLEARRPRLATFQRAPYIRITEQGWKLRFHSMTPDEVNVPAALKKVHQCGAEFRMIDTSFFLSRQTLLASERPGMAIWREKLFASMHRNAAAAADFQTVSVPSADGTAITTRISTGTAVQITSMTVLCEVLDGTGLAARRKRTMT